MDRPRPDAADVPDDPALVRLVEQAAARAAGLWSSHRGLA
ncbi:hypothetical protein FHW15_002711 [Terracoccus luteus]|jgi:hypothetical protein|uniref:Uncharacterized protein n=1 Tax=Terracoccus luteus TaxID=53356 RepID=A0A839PXT5_9MICO|nr:hypothetical protein [Terracoccus luteus]MCP2173185.1 hypothetical protein [Terracoccus luteus]